MKRARFTETQIVAVLKEADSGVPVKDLCRKHGISDATYYNWKAKYYGMELNELRRLKQLEDENKKLKQLVADQALDIQGLILSCHLNTTYDPLEAGESGNPLRVVFQCCQGFHERVFYGSYTAENAVRKPLLSDLIPEMFWRVQFRTVGRQVEKSDVGRDYKCFSLVPACLIHEHEDCFIGVSFRDYGEKQRH